MINYTRPVDLSSYGEADTYDNTTLPPLEMRRIEAAYAGLQSDGIPTYDMTMDELNATGKSSTSARIDINRNAKYNKEVVNSKEFIEAAGDASISEETRASLIQQAAEHQFRLNPFTAVQRDYIVSDDDQKDQEQERIHLDQAEVIGGIYQYNKQMDALRTPTRQAMSESPDIRKAGEAAMQAIPFVETYTYNEIVTDMENKGLIKDTTTWDGFTQALLAGESVNYLNEKFKTMGANDRIKFAKELMGYMNQSTVLGSNTTMREYVESSIIDGNWDVAQRALADTFSVLDWVGIGGLFGKGAKAGAKGARAIHNVYRERQIAKASAELERVKGVMQAKADTQETVGAKNPLSPASAADAAPSKAKSIFDTVEQSEGDEFANAMTGTSRNNYLITENQPQATELIAKRVDNINEKAKQRKVKEFIDANIPVKGQLGLDSKVIRELQYERFIDVEREARNGKLSAVMSSVKRMDADNAVMTHVYKAADNLPYARLSTAMTTIIKDFKAQGLKPEQIRYFDTSGPVIREMDLSEVGEIIKAEKADKEHVGSFAVGVDVNYDINFMDLRSFIEKGKTLKPKEDSFHFRLSGGFLETMFKGKAQGGITRTIVPPNVSMSPELYRIMASGQYRTRGVFNQLEKAHKAYADKMNSLAPEKAETFAQELYDLDLRTDPLEIAQRYKDPDLVEAWKQHREYWQYANTLDDQAEVARLEREGWHYQEIDRGEAGKFQGYVKPTNLGDFLQDVNQTDAKAIRYVDADGNIQEISRVDIDQLNDVKNLLDEYTSDGATRQATYQKIANDQGVQTANILKLMDETSSVRLSKIETPGDIKYIVVVNDQPFSGVKHAINPHMARRALTGNNFVMERVGITGEIRPVYRCGDAAEARRVMENLNKAHKNEVKEYQYTVEQAKDSRQAFDLGSRLNKDLSTYTQAPALGDGGKVVYRKPLAIGPNRKADLGGIMKENMRVNMEIAERVSLRDYLDSAKLTWIGKYQDLLPEAPNGAKYWPTDVNEINTKAHPVRGGRALMEWEYIRMNEAGELATLDFSYTNALDNIADMVDTHGDKTKLKKFIKGASKQHPINTSKDWAYTTMVSLNPASQALLNWLEAGSTVVGFGRESYKFGQLPNDYLALRAADLYGVERGIEVSNLPAREFRELHKAWTNAGLKTDPNLQKQFEAGLRDAKRSGEGDSFASQVRQGNVLGATKKAGSSVVETSHKIGIQMPEDFHKKFAWLAAQDEIKKKYGTNRLTQSQYDEALALTSELTLDTTRAGAVSLSQSVFGLPVQFIPTILKSVLRYMPFVGNAPWQAKAKLAMGAMVATGVPGFIQDFYNNLVSDYFPEWEPMDREGLSGWLTRGALFQILYEAADVDVNTRRFQSFTPVEVADSIGKIFAEGPISYALNDSPIASLGKQAWKTVTTDIPMLLEMDESALKQDAKAYTAIGILGLVTTGGKNAATSWLMYKSADDANPEQLNEAIVTIFGPQATVSSLAEKAYFDAKKDKAKLEEIENGVVEYITAIYKKKGDPNAPQPKAVYDASIMFILNHTKDLPVESQVRIMNKLVAQMKGTNAHIKAQRMAMSLLKFGNKELLRSYLINNPFFTEEERNRYLAD